MSRAFCLLNHALTERQLNELAASFSCERVEYPSAALAAQWSAVPVERELSAAYFAPFFAWLSAADAGDVLVIQGEFGATFTLVDFALCKRLIPVHAVTRRVAEETRDGEQVRRTYLFEHVCFRRYAYWREASGERGGA
jgi:hypothetical protein